ncbi:MAG: glycogen/starch synthase [Promethearchaeota archaeon]
MVLDLNNWKKNWRLMPEFFNDNEIEKITSRLRKLKIKNVVYCSFENRFAKSGGLASVTTNILPYLKEVNKIPNIILMTPLYSRITDLKNFNSPKKTFEVVFGNQKSIVEIYEYTWNYILPKNGSLKEYYIKADGFFDSKNRVNDPYIYFETIKEQNEDIIRKKNDDTIRKNAIFYCKVIPFTLKELGITEDIIFHLQDWQTALISLTSKKAMLDNILNSCGTVQTLHNSFDSFISKECLLKLIDKQRIDKFYKKYKKGLNALQIGLELVDAPINTVSDNFAKEFTSDILQTKYFARHLQKIFRMNGVFGVNNGMFIPFPTKFSKKNDFTVKEIKEIKSEKRQDLLEILDKYYPKERFGELNYKGETIKNLPDEIPIIVMSGRLDPIQKGYDILLRAVKKFKKDELKIILAPMPVRDSDLNYFREIAEECKGNLTVFPIRMEKGFHELQVGSTFGIMPSIYEPFGAAIEYMVNGTVTIARSTGGLVDQINHNNCGLLYKETSEFYNLNNIKEYSNNSNMVQNRDNNSWVQSMVESLYEALRNAIELYQNDNKYYEIIINGFKKAKKFSWDLSASRYFQIYKKVNNGF